MDKNTLIGFAASLGFHAFLLLALYLCGAFGGSEGVGYKGVGGMDSVGLGFVGFDLEAAKSGSASGLNEEQADNKELNLSKELNQAEEKEFFAAAYEEVLQAMDARKKRLVPELLNDEAIISKEDALSLKKENVSILKKKVKEPKERKIPENIWTDNTKIGIERDSENAARKKENPRSEKKQRETAKLRGRGIGEELLSDSGLGAGLGAGRAAGLGGTEQSGAAGEVRAFLVENYSYISRALAKAVIYPEKARRRGIKGTCYVSFLLENSGFVSAVSLVKSSGSEFLDKEAIAAVHRASPFPPPPGAVQLTVPIGFVLR